MQSSSVYENIRDGESRVLEFIKGKEKLVDKTDFKGKPTKKVQFIAHSKSDSKGRLIYVISYLSLWLAIIIALFLYPSISR
jgi:hypothetical protein